MSDPKRVSSNHIVIAAKMLVLAAIGTAAAGQANDVEWRQGPSALSMSMGKVVQSCRCMVTFEGPRWSRFVEAPPATAAEKVRQLTAPELRDDGFWLPRLPEAKSKNDAFATASIVVDAYVSQSGPSFKVDKSDRVPHIVPADGSVFDVSVRLPKEPLTFTQAFTFILNAVERQHDTKIAVWSPDDNTYFKIQHSLEPVKIERTTGRPAAHLLTDLFEPHNLTWLMTYSATEQGGGYRMMLHYFPSSLWWKSRF